MYKYPKMKKTFGLFSIEVEEGQVKQSEIIMLLGQNGMGKTTLFKLLTGNMLPDDKSVEIPNLRVSYKPQTLSPKFQGTVKELLYTKLGGNLNSPLFKTEVIKPMDIESLLDYPVQNLSGGEIQRVAIVLCLAKECDIYLIDEPSAYLDSEKRVIASKVMKKWIMITKRSALVVEHDFIMATYLADKIICFEGEPARKATCTSPQTLITGMNKFLQMMDVTFRRDPTNFRPRINKHESQKYQEQKKAGNYFILDKGKLTKEEELEEQEMARASKKAGGGGKKGKKDKDN